MQLITKTQHILRFKCKTAYSAKEFRDAELDVDDITHININLFGKCWICTSYEDYFTDMTIDEIKSILAPTKRQIKIEMLR